MNDLIQLNELSEHQKVLLSMLKDFDAVCEKHGIRYMLFAGTALGAVTAVLFRGMMMPTLF